MSGRCQTDAVTTLSIDAALIEKQKRKVERTGEPNLLIVKYHLFDGTADADDDGC